MSKLSEEQVQERLAQGTYPGWQRKDEKWLTKKYRVREFLDGIEFVRQVALAAEELNHHPMIAIDYKLVTLSVTSWSAGGITELDFELMAKCDSLFSR
ncbi:4a-hydroxytetrahydrobiopterin dehydratase [Paenibacillus koleovorans]|uniref:4a-hydroxytetrahydrobiopterin dehydratase n=1 Tax=Paenibacillus koleovorans TaxID=121608 RepID=UPI000FD7CB42|nr:4a-hydroxytetrahydrobiopterin dehydratase [Paenibacillus koleovorans]